MCVCVLWTKKKKSIYKYKFNVIIWWLDEVYKSKTTKKKKNQVFFFFPFLFCNCSASLIWSMHCTEVNVSARPLSTLTPCDSELSGLLLLAAGGSVWKRLAHQDLVNLCTRRVDKTRQTKSLWFVRPDKCRSLGTCATFDARDANSKKRPVLKKL